MTAAQAYELKVTFFGSHSGSFNANDLVFVDDYLVAGPPCTALDGRTRLLYGQSARITILMKSFKGAVNVNFVVVAANASISGQNNSVEVESLGLPKSVQLALLDARTAAIGGLDVKNYSDFMAKVDAADRKAINESQSGTVQLIGKVVSGNDMNIAAARVYALAWIRDKRQNCEAAISRHPNQAPEIQVAIRETYRTVAGGCTPNAEGIEKAKEYLKGLQIDVD